MAGAAANGMTRITLSFLLSLLSDNNLGPGAPANNKHHWSYKGIEGPQNWPIHFKGCGGTKQSPIDIDTDMAVYDRGLGAFQLDNFEAYSDTNGPTMLNITNNGHAASVRVTSKMRVSGGGLKGTYKTAEFHFHWGSTDDVGSEHAMNGRKFPLEMHIVNYAEKYDTIKEAMEKPDGLAVLGVFFELSETDNLEFSGLGQALNYVKKAGEHNLVSQVRLRSLLPEDISRYWRYSGSLTTPMCFESVTWTVFATPQKISRSQLDSLRSLLHENGHDKGEPAHTNKPTPSRLVDNWRPVQPLNGRTVYRSFDDWPRGVTAPSDARQSPSGGRNKVSSAVDNYIQKLVPNSLNNGFAEKGNTTSEKGQSLPVSDFVPSNVKMKIEPTAIQKSYSVSSAASPMVSTLGKSKNDMNNLRSSKHQTDSTKASPSGLEPSVASLQKNLEIIQQLQKQQELIKLQSQQQMRKLIQLHQMQLNNAQQFGASSSLFPSVLALEGQSQPISSTATRVGGMILNDGKTATSVTQGRDQAADMSWGRQSNQAKSTYQNNLEIQQHVTPLPSSSSPQNQRYVKPIDPNFVLRLTPQNQRVFLQAKSQKPPSPTYTYNTGKLNRREFSQQRSINNPNAFYSQINRNSQKVRQNAPTSAFRQYYRTYPELQKNIGSIGTRQPQRQFQSVKNSQQTVLESLLEKLSPNPRQQVGSSTLTSPAARMLPTISDVNSISRSGTSSGRGTSNTARKLPMTPGIRHSGLSNNRIPSTITSGMNPIPYSSNQRRNRVPGPMSSQIPNHIRAASPKRPSSPSASSYLPSSPSLSYGTKTAYPSERSRQPLASNGHIVNNNWFFSDRNRQGHQEDLPQVFLHRVEKPVRIRRPFYERLYNI